MEDIVFERNANRVCLRNTSLEAILEAHASAAKILPYDLLETALYREQEWARGDALRDALRGYASGYEIANMVQDHKGEIAQEDVAKQVDEINARPEHEEYAFGMKTPPLDFEDEDVMPLTTEAIWPVVKQLNRAIQNWNGYNNEIKKIIEMYNSKSHLPIGHLDTYTVKSIAEHFGLTLSAVSHILKDV